MQIEANCSTCEGRRKHVVIYTHAGLVRIGPQEADSVRISVLRCLSCDQLLALHRQEGRGAAIVTTAPPEVWRSPPPWLDGAERKGGANSLGPYAMGVLRQVYVALNAGALELAAMGVRAIWERLMIEIVGDHGSFRANLVAYQSSGAITLPQREALETVLELGHAATHRGFTPTKADLATALDVTEGLLRPMYDNDNVRSLRQRIPPRNS